MTVNTNRRDVLATLAMLGAVPAVSFGQQAQPAPLPLNTPGLDHLDVIVPDVEKSARFYMGLFRTALHAQPFQGGQRYFVLLGPLPENRTVGYIAIGAARGRGTYIGHFCTSVVNWRENSNAIFAKMKEEFRTAGFGEFPGGTGVAGTFKDPDGIEIQFLPSPDTLVTAAVPSDLVPAQQGLVVPQRVDSVLVRVSNLDKALQFYRTLYGREASRNGGTAQFNFRNGSRLQLEQVSYTYGGGGPVRIARYGVFVKPFDRAAAAAAIAQLGGKVVQDDGKVLRLTDVDGIELDLVAGT